MKKTTDDSPRQRIAKQMVIVMAMTITVMLMVLMVTMAAIII